MAMKLLILLLVLSLLSLQSMAEERGSVVFFDTPNHRFIRSNSLEIEGQGKTLSMDEVVAAVSVLLGSAPGSLSIESSDKLNEVLLPSPFDKPHAIFFVEVIGIKEPLLSSAHSNSKVGSTFSSVLGSTEADSRPLLDVNQVSVLPLDEALSAECDATCVGKELAHLGVVYAGSPESLDGKLIFPLLDGSLNLDMAKKSDLQFALSLVSLVRSIQKVVADHEFFSGIRIGQHLLISRFTGIEALKEEYGSGNIVQQGTELFKVAVVKSFESLQKSYEGKIVGVVVSNPSANSGSMVELAARESRWLEEAISPNATMEGIAEIVLVRRSLALVTGIILLVSTLLGIYFLLYMPLTRDTLLYSNVKLD